MFWRDDIGAYVCRFCCICRLRCDVDECGNVVGVFVRY